jgi:hypothetical protein
VLHLLNTAPAPVHLAAVRRRFAAAFGLADGGSNFSHLLTALKGDGLIVRVAKLKTSHVVAITPEGRKVLDEFISVFEVAPKWAEEDLWRGAPLPQAELR